MAVRIVAGLVSPSCASQPMKPPANESPAPVGIDDVLERERGRREDAVLVEEQRARVAALDDDGARPELADGARRGGQVGLARELARLLVVEEQHVDALEQLEQRAALARDPEVHGVARHELGRCSR